MLSMLPLFASLLVVAQANKLEVTNVRATYGIWGPPRTDAKLSIGDAIHFSFDVVGLQPDELRRVRYRTVLEVFDSKGKVIYQPGPVDAVQVDLFGMGQVRQSVHLLTGLDQAPDTYRIKVTIQDVHAKKEASFTREVVLQPIEFGIIRYQITSDRDAQTPTAAIGAVGQILYVNAIVVGFKRDPQKEERGSVTVEMVILDDRDKPLSPKPLHADAKDITNDVQFVPLRLEVPLQRAGSFKVSIKVTDQVGKKTSTLSVPVQIVEVK